jgi:hypothetical protein
MSKPRASRGCRWKDCIRRHWKRRQSQRLDQGRSAQSLRGRHDAPSCPRATGSNRPPPSHEPVCRSAGLEAGAPTDRFMGRGNLTPRSPPVGRFQEPSNSAGSGPPDMERARSLPHGRGSVGRRATTNKAATVRKRRQLGDALKPGTPKVAMDAPGKDW